MYSMLAEFYDDLMDVDYMAFLEYYKTTWEKYGTNPEIVLDLACGTGNMTVLYEANYDVIGIDISPEMLSKAREKVKPETLLLCMDMRKLDLFGTIDACCCTLDGMGSMQKEEDFLAVLSKVNLFLSPLGIFIFDIISPQKFKEELDGASFFYDTDKVACIWQNSVIDNVCHFKLTYFEPKKNGSYTRIDEEMSERIWEIYEVKSLIASSQMELLEVQSGNGRIFFVCRKGGNTGNWK